MCKIVTGQVKDGKELLILAVYPAEYDVAKHAACW